MDEKYWIDEAGIDELGRTGIGWQPVLEMLYSADRKIRGHLGSVLRVAGRDPSGRLLLVALLEEEDDRYFVISARELRGDEAEAVARLIGEDE